MAQKIVINQRNQILASKIYIADTFFARLKGLMGSVELSQGAGLLISPCQQVHTHFMRYAIDVIFLDCNYRVVHIEYAMRPWKFSPYIKNARSVLELNVGEAKMLELDDQLIISA